MPNGHNLNYVIAIGLTLVAIIGIVGLIWIAATKGFSADANNMGPVIAIVATAVGAMAGVLTTHPHGPPNGGPPNVGPPNVGPPNH